MDALSFAAGLVAGIKNSGGGQTVTDPDYKLWQDMPDPADNQTVYLFRTTATNMSLTIDVEVRWDGITDSYFNVDWGDGTVQKYHISELSSGLKPPHQYTNTGIYTVVCTTSNSDTIYDWRPYGSDNITNYVVAIKCGDSIIMGARDYTLISLSRLKYIRISPNTPLENKPSYFSYCYALQYIEYKGTPLTIVPSGLFSYCYCLALNNWDFSHVTAVDSAAFMYAASLKTIDLPICTSIGSSAFSSCSNLLKITVADNCTIGSKAFEYCYSLFPVPV